MDARRRLHRITAAVADRAEALHLWSVRMGRRDSARWASAQDLGDLGELVIEWLEGRIHMTPGHLAPPDPETIPLVPALTVANRAGFVTNGSQLARFNETGCHRCCGSHAWVEGFATDDVMDRLLIATMHTSLRILSCRGNLHCDHREAGWMRCPWEECVEFWAECSPAVRLALRECWYVIVLDPEPGRNVHLWPTLEGLAVPWRAG